MKTPALLKADFNKCLFWGGLAGSMAVSGLVKDLASRE